ncbi:MAG: hypothetical protein A2087_11615 [Spirochaetes bacterium GWD1_61_31]|nr:MAG: hypothetical protein A2Y37_14845 [Spirochaetes bacterium GWB1_60_80]OHD30319.1 MAG: hypothetical protein A2004_02880 [Spirochaetes bacterium GWC1_61_12]OHD35847.1 MAG: hypothetical protein A2087_11615 [Spirochaetes bacterium GWD1_61_31]OHD46789.1 MAG: hypothetical protein A2Y35_10785 [Spirochaetes bacterium GWE1_60_18]OHD61241.1 MAG: hypothetical protein A2Y32_13080 [Spirochaetes bacterium GWF1_60_12]HAP42999.1 DNA-3-methyladenine glycosylase [Spirochaetaceae bacterium]
MPETGLPPYCAYCAGLPAAHPDRIYHDRRYGFPPPKGEAGESWLFGLLLLEINQAGLGWSMMLRKEENFRRAYVGFSIDAVAAFGETDRLRLLADSGIIRNRRKVDAAIENARRLQAQRPGYGSFQGWLDAHQPRSLDAWITLFRATLVFTGPEIVNEFLMSSGYLDGAHGPACPVRVQAIAAGPAWTRSAAAPAGV